MTGLPTPPSGGWPCQVCNLPGRTVPNHGEACEHCQKAVADWDDPGIPTPTVYEILPPRYRDHDEHDALQDARAELAGDGVRMTTREAVAMSLNCTRGNGDMYPTLRDSVRHPFGLPSSPTVPKDGHPAPATSTGAPAPDAAAAHPLSRAAAADGGPPIFPDLAA